MKTNSPSVLAFLTAVSTLAVAPLSAAPSDAIPFGVGINQVNCYANAPIARGATKLAVLRVLGAGYRALSPDVWVYQNRHADSEAANAKGCDVLVLTFVDGQVAELKVVNSRAVALIASSLTTGTNSTRVAQK